MHWEDAFWHQSSRQHGLVAKFQLPRMGCDSDDWWRARSSGRWVDKSSRVLAAKGVPSTDEQRVVAAQLDACPGGFLHAATALAWFGLPGYDLRKIMVARPYGLCGAPSTLAEVHRLRSVRAHDVVVVRGVATESVVRAIWAEAARYAAPHRVDFGILKFGRLLDIAERRGLVTWAGLAEAVEDIQQRGRSGTRLMRALSEARPPGSSNTDSRQEERLEQVLSDRGVRSLRRQPVVGGHEPIGRTDHRDDRLPLVVETNSLTFHTTPSDQEADERRYAALNDAGFTVAVVWEPDLWSRPQVAVETVQIARRHAAAGRAITVHSPGCPWADARFGSSEAIHTALAWNRDLAA